MTNQKPDLNLARKWRPQTFDTIIGQDVSMRMLKNSLYLKKFFPVYLFAGQRGCGKTSTARVFATAINCAQLPEFQKTPTAQLPCLTCTSCIAMIQGNHPDFIEIDAASHTGVDNVRSIIESSSYMPLMGNKKIYLIDEAHMLSKAAFNAFLKILEEPPMSVMFILATTETQKIPPTVLSRCFQLAFNPINTTALKTHLRSICERENVTIEDEALDLIIDETEGSARDAINLLERVRFSDATVTATSVLAVLGKMSITDVIDIFNTVLAQNPNGLLEKLTLLNFEQRSPTIFWDMLVHLCRMLIWVKYNVVTLPNAWTTHKASLTHLASGCSVNRLQGIMNLFWEHEELFLRTNKKHIVLETVLLMGCQPVNAQILRDVALAGSSSGRAPLDSPAKRSPEVTPIQAPSQDELSTLKVFQHKPLVTPQRPVDAPRPVQAAPAPSVQIPTVPTVALSEGREKPVDASDTSDWGTFQQEVAKLADQLLYSILLQTTPGAEQDNPTLYKVQLSSDSPFFKNKIEESKNLWLPLLQNTIGKDYLGFLYMPAPTNTVPPRQITNAQVATVDRQVPVTPKPTAQAAFTRYPQTRASSPSGPMATPFTITDPAKWPTASLILKHFPGKIKKI